MANTRKNDREYKICFPEEFALLGKTDSGKYFVLEPDGIQRNPMESQRSLAELSEAKSSVAQISEAKPKTASAVASNARASLKEYLFSLPWMNDATWKQLQAFRKDMEDDLIQFAADQAEAYGAESFAYLRKILYSYLDSGFKTRADAEAAEAQRLANKPSCNTGRREPEVSWG